jgi:hypothetical protein
MKENDESATSSVYSLKRHEKKQHKKRRSTSHKRQHTTTIEVIKEETVESVALKDSIKGDDQDQQVKLAALLNDYIA